MARVEPAAAREVDRPRVWVRRIGRGISAIVDVLFDLLIGLVFKSVWTLSMVWREGREGIGSGVI